MTPEHVASCKAVAELLEAQTPQLIADLKSECERAGETRGELDDVLKIAARNRIVTR
jgi:hypothetical protein